MLCRRKRRKNYQWEQVNFRTTDDFIRIAERESRRNLKWFFEVYARQPELPKLIVERQGNQLNMSWETPKNLPFPLPVEVKIGGEIKKIEMKNGRGSLLLPADAKFEIDPNGWLLRSLS